MARKRMFDSEIINQDSFYDLPMEAKALYFLLGMEADDEGFVSPKKVLRLYGGTEDSIKILVLKKYIIPFSSGVIVITDWKRNNYLDKNRIKETIYLEEKSALIYDEASQKYELNENVANPLLPSVKQMFNKCLTRIEENRIEENRIEENRIEESMSEAKAPNTQSIIDLPTNRFNTANEVYSVSNELCQLLIDTYQNVDVIEELKKMKAWLTTNPQKRKTKRGMERFINSWLSREQDKGAKINTITYTQNKSSGVKFSDFLEDNQNTKDNTIDAEYKIIKEE